MRSRGARRRGAGAGVVLLASALVLVPSSSASATTVLTVAFTATVQLGTGLDVPCVTSNKLCPIFFPGLVGVQFGQKGEPDPEVHPGGNRTTYAVTSDACVAGAVNVEKPGASPAVAGACSLATSGWVNGFCGLSEASTAGMLTLPAPVVGTTQAVAVILEVTDVGGAVVLTGVAAHGGRLGNLHGVGVLTAVPEPGMPVGNDCLSKTADRFVLTATMAVKVLTP